MRLKYNQKSAIIEKISIHAPIVGCDYRKEVIQMYKDLISIHAPIVGCDTMLLDEGYAVLISIHAPIVGCDRRNR